MDEQQNRYNSNRSQQNSLGCLFLILFLFGATSWFAISSLGNSGSNDKFKRAEAKNYIGAMNRAQQAAYLEKGSFANSIDKLDLGIRSITNHYKYSLSATSTSAFNYAIPHLNDSTDTEKNFQYSNRYKSRILRLKYVGGVFVVPNTKDAGMTISIMCMANSSGSNLPAKPSYKYGKLACGTGTTEVGRSSN